MSAEIKLRQCGKKLPRHCDVNHDNRIGFTEWLNCLNINHIQTPAQPNGKFLDIMCNYFQIHFFFLSETSTTIIAKRRGPNPLESYLKGDD